MLNLYDYFQGSWRFERHIQGHGNAQGIAIFKKNLNPMILNYQEQGTFENLSQQSFKIHREYLYEFETEHIHVYHARHEEKGAFFFELQFNPSKQQGLGHHLCIQDHYQATYQLIDEHQFQLYFKVHGPQKNFLIETFYSKYK